jgi:hypothetical protein
MKYDVFNGDADGICALHQLRLAYPDATPILVTGVKRDIKLLDQLVEVENAQITVLDISLASNREALDQILKLNRVRYIDHHYSGDLPESENLEATVDPDPETCTSLIVDRLLDGKYKPWAIVGAYGDNLHGSARLAGKSISLSETDLNKLCETGELLNYNGYGKSVDDLYFHPAELYKALKPYEHPLDFYSDSEAIRRLRDGFDSDMDKARLLDPFQEDKNGRVFRLPDEPWSRRVAGVFINEKAREDEALAHALLVENGDGTYLSSVRAPLANRKGADTLCRAFPTGGGRAAAAGINNLPENMIPDFLRAFTDTFTV